MVSFKKLRQMIEIQGNGNIVTREVSVSTFIRLHLGCTGVIELHQSDEEKVIFETDENLMEYFVATNAGRTLFVSNEANLRRPVFTRSVIKIFFRQLDKLVVRNHHGNVVCPHQLILSLPLEVKMQSTGDTELDLKVPAIKLSNMTYGNVVLKGACDKINIKNMAQGNLDASQLKAGELSIKNMAEGNVLLHAESSIQITHYGHGYIHYTGNGVVKDVKQYGDGEVKYVKEDRNL